MKVFWFCRGVAKMSVIQFSRSSDLWLPPLSVQYEHYETFQYQEKVCYSMNPLKSFMHFIQKLSHISDSSFHRMVNFEEDFQANFHSLSFIESL
jgi:hypothetical protein